jgi:hypothetical protein
MNLVSCPVLCGRFQSWLSLRNPIRRWFCMVTPRATTVKSFDGPEPPDYHRNPWQFKLESSCELLESIEAMTKGRFYEVQIRQIFAGFISG